MAKTLPILVAATTCLYVMRCGDAAPPQASAPGSPVAAQTLPPGADLVLAQADPPQETDSEPTQDTEPAAKSADEKAADNKATAAAALKKARELLTQHHSVRANVIETVEIGNHGFTATGRYLQRGETKIRLEFDLQIGQTSGALMEVCDGEILYTRHIIGEEIQLTRRNVREILEAARASQTATADLFIAEMGLGGLPGMLAALEQAMTFDVLKDDTLDDKSVWMVQGTWNQQYRDRWLQGPGQPPGSDGQPGARELPSLIPDLVRIFLDRKTGFPLKIEYRKKVPGRNHTRAMLTLAFREIELNGAIDDSEFTFIPPETPIPIDLTPFYKERIRLAVQSAGQKTQAPTDAPDAGQTPQP